MLRARSLPCASFPLYFREAYLNVEGKPDERSWGLRVSALSYNSATYQPVVTLTLSKPWLFFFTENDDAVAWKNSCVET